MSLIISYKGEKIVVKMQAKNHVMEASMAEPNLRHSCPECGKIFPSEKSMYGHMKCHPKRTYRGINQRSTAAEESSSSPSNSVSSERSDSEITAEQPMATRELTAALPRWKVTAPRGRKLAPHEPAGRSPGIFQEARKELCLTVQEEMSKLSSLKKIISLIEGGAHEKNYYAGDGFQHQDMHRKNLYRLSGFEEELKEQFKSETSFQSMIDTRKDKNIKKRKLSEIEQQSVIASYVCEKCQKKFTSTQALGGHMRSHRKEKSCSFGRAGHLLLEEPSGSKSYACKICHKAFRTGQALGGHQRRHCHGGFAIAPARSIALKEEAVTDGRPVLNFDLNELPPSEDQEAVDHEVVP